MDYTVDRDDHRGRHIVFASAVDETNFIAACSVAIELAKQLFDDELAVNFTASGVAVQVVHSDDVDVQFALWRRRVMAKQEAPRSSILVFLRYEKSEVSSFGMLSLRTTLDTDAGVKEALTAATTEWINTTEAGRSLWNSSCADVNIGDLSSSSAFQDVAFLAALRERGVEYVDCFVGECDHAIPYDEVLVNKQEVVEEATNSPKPDHA